MTGELPLLFPPPRKVTLTGGEVAIPRALHETIEIRRDDSLPPRSHRIVVASASGDATISVTASDDDAEADARCTVNQLQQHNEGRCPCLVIDDAPALVSRGVMIDVSRDRVPTTAHLRDMLDAFAVMRLNHVECYTEHTFAYAGCDEVWGEASPLTADDVREVDAHAAAHGITLAPNQNCFGHLEPWLRHPRFKHLAETLSEFEFDGVPMTGPFSLCPTDPRSSDWVRDRIRELAPCFARATTINIGGDETVDLGVGRSRDAVAQRGSFAVYRDFMEVIAAHAHAADLRPMYWADIALREPQRIGEMPADMIELAWGYEADSPFDAWANSLVGAGRTFWFCPGTSAWRSIVGRGHLRRTNNRRAIDVAFRSGAGGAMVTDWGDCGHRQVWSVSLYAIAEAAALMWNPTCMDDDASCRHLEHAIGRHVFGHRTGDVGTWLHTLGDVDASIRDVGRFEPSGGRQPLHNAGALFEDLHPSGLATSLPRDAEAWEAVRARLMSHARAMPSSLPGWVKDELDHTLAVASFAADRAVVRRLNEGDRAAASGDLLAQLESIMAAHESLWKLRSRPGGFQRSQAWYADLRRRICTPPPEGTPPRHDPFASSE